MDSSQRTVLIVDDCPEDRYTYRRYLLQDQSQQYTILEAESGQAALEVCQQAQPDIILLDFLLPDLTGLELLTQLQGQLQEVVLPVILLTGQGSEAIAVQAMKAGVQDYLAKGKITAKDLRYAIELVIQKSKLQIQLRESEERLKLALEATQMGIWEWNIQSNTVIWSEQVAPLFGLPLGASLPTYEAFLEAVHPDDRTDVSQAVLRALQEKNDYEMEFRTVWADGTVRWIGGRGRIYCDAIERPLRLVGTVMDITKSKQAQAERLQRIERERLVAQMAQQVHRSLDVNAVLQTTVDEVRQFLQTDRAFIYRFYPNFSGVIEVESVGEGWASILSEIVEDSYFTKTQGEDYRQGRIQATADIYTAGLTNCHVELLARFQVRASLAVPILQGEKLWGLLVANHCSEPRSWQTLEIDLLKQLATQVGIAIQQSEFYQQSQIAREQAERANRVKDEFLAVLSHELRTPLNPILGWSKMLRAGRLDADKTKEALLTIERNAKLQSQLIEDLLDVSCILRGKLVLQEAPVDLATLIQAALETVRLAAEAKQMTLQTVLPETGIWVTGDAGRLQQVVWNLLSNAVKFTPAGGRVEIRLEPIDSKVQIQVIDTGKGISADFLPHVFDYFRQEDSAITRQFGGLGLGLAIVRQIVELHGGTVAVSSAGENQGATFTVCLPLLKQEESYPTDLDSTAASEFTESLQGLKILVVDDDVDSREFVTFVLEQDGAQVQMVASGFDALQALLESQPDILISDIGMPEIDGYELVRQVRLWTAEQGGQIPAIALTAYAGEYDQKQAIEVGFQQHLSKPVDPIELVKAVARLGHHHLNR